MTEPKRGWLFRERPGGRGGPWSSWKVAELGIPSLLVKAQDRPDEYEVEEIMPVAEHTQALSEAADQAQKSFTDENPYAAEAERLLQTAIEKRSEHVLRRGEIYATLAVAYQQRLLDGTLRDYLPGRVA